MTKKPKLGHGFPVARRTLDAIDRLDRIDESWEGKFSFMPDRIHAWT
jgi:hypothetical protein